MPSINHSTFWGAVTIIASAFGGLLLLSISHSGEPKHSEAALESDVTQIQVRLERVQTNVEHNKDLLGELKGKIGELQIEQNESSSEILEAIRNVPYL